MSAATSQRPIPLRKRLDVQVQPQTYQGQAYWVLKDPLSLEYFRLRAEEFAIWNLLDGSSTFRQLKEEAERRFAPRKVSYRQLESLLNLLHRRRLVISDVEGQGEIAWRRRTEDRRRRRLAWWLNPLAVRFPGVDPEPLLRVVHRWLGWCFQPLGFALAFAVILWALGLIAVEFDTFQARLPAFHQFFRGENAVWFMAAVCLAKVTHELGHALACKHYGGECHEIGPMLLVFTPALYCDTSDSWMLASKWQRAMVGAAGMYVELVLAALGTLVWWHTQPGALNSICLAIMFVSSISTLLFNANPLLRYDGYYILADLLEIPNLSGRSRAALQAAAKGWLLKRIRGVEPLLPARHRFWFAAYAAASTVYRYVVLVLILWFLGQVLKPYGLQVIGNGLIFMVVAAMVIAPLRQAANYFSAPGRLRQLRPGRISFSVLILLTLAAAVAFVPLPQAAFAPASIQPREAHRVYASSAGMLAEVRVQPGDAVAAGAPLAVVRNRELALETEKLIGRHDRLRVRAENLVRQQSDDPAAEQQIPHVRAAMFDVQQQLDRLRREQQRLTLRAPRAGIVIAPPSRPAAPSSANELDRWTGRLLDRENLGSRLEAGDLVCLVGQPNQWEAVVAVTQSVVNDIHVGQLVTIKLRQYPDKVFAGTVAEIAENFTNGDADWSGSAGDDFLQEAYRQWEQADGTPPPYLIRIPLTVTETPLVAGFDGEAKLILRPRSLGERLWRYFLETVRFS